MAIESNSFLMHQTSISVGLWLKALQQDYQDEETLKLLYDSTIMYNRTALNTHENFIFAFDELYGKKANNLISEYQKKCNKFAENLYWLNICDVSAIPDLDKLTKEKDFDQFINLSEATTAPSTSLKIQ